MACRSATGSPPASTRDRRGPIGRPFRSCRAPHPAANATIGAPTTSASEHAGRRPTTSAKATPTALLSSPNGPIDNRTLSVSAGTPVVASVKVTNTGRRAGDRDGAPLLSGHGVRGARAAPPRALGAPAGDARSRSVRDAQLHGHGRVAVQVRPGPRGGSAGLARPQPAENPDRLFLVQHEGEALDAIERFGDAPCVLTFTLTA
jgi:hypothetical protein